MYKKYEKVIVENLPFHKAMKALSKGKKVSRAIWGGYWEINRISRLDRHGISARPAIVAVLKDGGWAVASPYQDDMLATDWMIVE